MINLSDENGIITIAKTGMGSSAALTTSLVAAMLSFLGIIRLSGQRDLTIVYRLSQIAHSVAQGKIGSGFDVSAALFGKDGI